MKNIIIYLIGFPGVGKYTIAKEICVQADFRLVDNHLINNPVFSLIKMDGETPLSDQVWENVERIRQVVADTICDLSPPDYSFVLTNMLLDSSAVDRQLYEEVKALALHRKALFVPVLLSCDLQEHEQRIATPDRQQRFKQTRIARVRELHEGDAVLSVEHQNLFGLDVTDITPTQSAEAILHHVCGCV